MSDEASKDLGVETEEQRKKRQADMQEKTKNIDLKTRAVRNDIWIPYGVSSGRKPL